MKKGKKIFFSVIVISFIILALLVFGILLNIEKDNIIKIIKIPFLKSSGLTGNAIYAWCDPSSSGQECGSYGFCASCQPTTQTCVTELGCACGAGYFPCVDGMICQNGICERPPYCGDFICNNGETCSSCKDDCGFCTDFCGDLKCNNQETCQSCPGDCGGCGSQYFCGDSKCTSGESCSSCPKDCGTCPTTCGNTLCDSNIGETCKNCPGDCGQCCGNKKCDSNFEETCGSCPGDCGKCCGNLACDKGLGETCSICPQDCGQCPTSCPSPFVSVNDPGYQTASSGFPNTLKTVSEIPRSASFSVTNPNSIESEIIVLASTSNPEKVSFFNSYPKLGPGESKQINFFIASNKKGEESPVTYEAFSRPSNNGAPVSIGTANMMAYALSDSVSSDGVFSTGTEYCKLDPQKEKEECTKIFGSDPEYGNNPKAIGLDCCYKKNSDGLGGLCSGNTPGDAFCCKPNEKCYTFASGMNVLPYCKIEKECLPKDKMQRCDSANKNICCKKEDTCVTWARRGVPQVSFCGKQQCNLAAGETNCKNPYLTKGEYCCTKDEKCGNIVKKTKLGGMLPLTIRLPLCIPQLCPTGFEPIKGVGPVFSTTEEGMTIQRCCNTATEIGSTNPNGVPVCYNKADRVGGNSQTATTSVYMIREKDNMILDGIAYIIKPHVNFSIAANVSMSYSKYPDTTKIETYKYTDHDGILAACTSKKALKTVSVTIGKKGGKINYGEFTMTIPKNALKTNVKFTLVQYNLSGCYIPGQTDEMDQVSEVLSSAEALAPDNIENVALKKPVNASHGDWWSALLAVDGTTYNSWKSKINTGTATLSIDLLDSYTILDYSIKCDGSGNGNTGTVYLYDALSNLKYSKTYLCKQFLVFQEQIIEPVEGVKKVVIEASGGTGERNIAEFEMYGFYDGSCQENCLPGYECNNKKCICKRATCQSLGKTCGEWSDGCGATINCGCSGDCSGSVELPEKSAIAYTNPSLSDPNLAIDNNYGTSWNSGALGVQYLNITYPLEYKINTYELQCEGVQGNYGTIYFIDSKGKTSNYTYQCKYGQIARNSYALNNVFANKVSVKIGERGENRYDSGNVQEFKVFGCIPQLNCLNCQKKCTAQNIAIGQATDATKTASGSYTRSAVDGNPGSSWNSGDSQDVNYYIGFTRDYSIAAYNFICEGGIGNFGTIKFYDVNLGLLGSKNYSCASYINGTEFFPKIDRVRNIGIEINGGGDNRHINEIQLFENIC
ncbi:hypothetical protein J4218_03220 [Candidatus Pacearchaeota archaeon]|nr:hypothetical protein [Candidatus Pacearchaeota archaeon]